MARSRTLIVGGGIAAGPAFTTGRVVQVVQSDPATIGDTKIQVIPAASAAVTSQILIPGEAPNSLALGEGVFLPHAFLARSVAIGRNITPAVPTGAGENNAQEQVLIGVNFTYTAADNFKVFARLVAIGPNIQIGPNDCGSSVLIGQDARGGIVGNSSSSVGIGASVRVNDGSNSVAIGPQAAVSGGANVAIGNLATSVASGVAVGNNARAQGANGTVAIGFGSQVVPNEGMALGAFAVVSSGHTGSIALGRNARTGAANQLAIGAGVNLITDVVIGAGVDNVGTTPSMVIVRASAVTNGVNLAGYSLRLAAGRGTGAAQSTVLELATPSVNASGSTPQTDVVQIRISQSDGGPGMTNIQIWNVSNGAGAAAGSLTNAPVAGNPTFWLPITVMGIVRYIPCW